MIACGAASATGMPGAPVPAPFQSHLAGPGRRGAGPGGAERLDLPATAPPLWRQRPSHLRPDHGRQLMTASASCYSGPVRVNRITPARQCVSGGITGCAGPGNPAPAPGCGTAAGQPCCQPHRRTSQGHQLPLSTCHVRSGPWTTWSVTGPDRTVAPRPWRPASRQPRSGTPATPPCRANQAAAATGAGWPPRSDTRDSANADPLAQADLAVAAVTGVAAD
jgi:hypothetical protein